MKCMSNIVLWRPVGWKRVPNCFRTQSVKWRVETITTTSSNPLTIPGPVSCLCGAHISTQEASKGGHDDN